MVHKGVYMYYIDVDNIEVLSNHNDIAYMDILTCGPKLLHAYCTVS